MCSLGARPFVQYRFQHRMRKKCLKQHPPACVHSRELAHKCFFAAESGLPHNAGFTIVCKLSALCRLAEKLRETYGGAGFVGPAGFIHPLLFYYTPVLSSRTTACACSTFSDQASVTDSRGLGERVDECSRAFLIFTPLVCASPEGVGSADSWQDAEVLTWRVAGHRILSGCPVLADSSIGCSSCFVLWPEVWQVCKSRVLPAEADQSERLCKASTAAGMARAALAADEAKNQSPGGGRGGGHAAEVAVPRTIRRSCAMR